AKCPCILKKDSSFVQGRKSDKQLTAITNFAANCLYGSKGSESSDDWFLDSGATTHLSRRNDWLEKCNCDKSNTVSIANGSQIRSTGCDTVKIPLATKKTMVAKDLHRAPELAVNLLSVSRIASQGKSLIFDISGCRIASRLDICHAVRVVSSTGKAHWIAVKRIVRYLKATKNMKLVYKRAEGSLTAYCNADWANDTTGFVVCLPGTAVSWNFKKQRTVALSTAEAEYVALSHTMQEITWLQSQCIDRLLCDNSAAINISQAKNTCHEQKHIDIRYHFVKEKVQAGDALIEHVAT
ncbi:hypothetical protein M514_18982, partial [Trichuris suis]